MPFESCAWTNPASTDSLWLEKRLHSRTDVTLKCGPKDERFERFRPAVEVCTTLMAVALVFAIRSAGREIVSPLCAATQFGLNS